METCFVFYTDDNIDLNKKKIKGEEEEEAEVKKTIRRRRRKQYYFVYVKVYIFVLMCKHDESIRRMIHNKNEAISQWKCWIKLNLYEITAKIKPNTVKTNKNNFEKEEIYQLTTPILFKSKKKHLLKQSDPWMQRNNVTKKKLISFTNVIIKLYLNGNFDWKFD